ncbi:MAG: cytochrome c oxidase subunit I, partial [Bdellovibrionales bacterium]|nr:cytochrome c oxidase subunit I [Bdellovibrionales bacterium]
GAWTIGTGFLIALFVIIHALRKGEKAPDNPWGAKTLEWTTASPPPHENFLTEPVVTAGPYEYR